MDAWDKIMSMAQEAGFIVQSYGGTATLATHDAQRSAGIYEKTQKMNGHPVEPE